MKSSECRIVLHDIRSTHNVGSAFRTSDAAGISHIYLTGYTPAPVDQFKRERKDISKVALGAEKAIPWTQEKNVAHILQDLKKEDFIIIAVEQDEGSVDYKTIGQKIPKGKKIAFLFGNEVGGVPKDVLKQCDVIAEIPMAGKKESLNVAVTIGIALFRILDL